MAIKCSKDTKYSLDKTMARLSSMLLGLGELCSKTLLLCYAPMLSNALIMLLRIVIMLTVCLLYNIIHEHVVTWW